MLLKPCCDDLVFIENGLPGIVIGNGHGYSNVWWTNGKTTKLPWTMIVFISKYEDSFDYGWPHNR